MAKKAIKNVNLGHGTGRRKCSVARVYLRKGKGQILINGKEIDKYFANPLLVYTAKQPLVAASVENKYDIVINAFGGGISGQAGAVCHGIARALVDENEEMRPIMKKGGFLTRDSRMVERKKYGQRGARKKFQFSKR